MYNDRLIDWSYVYIKIEVSAMSAHESFKLAKDGYTYSSKTLSGNSNMTLYSGSLSSGEYELTYIGNYKKNLFTSRRTFTYKYRFEVDKTNPSYTLKAGGKAKKTAEATAKAAKKTAQETKRATFFVVRHWKGCLIVGGIAFIVLLLFGGLSSCSLFGGNSGSGLIASSYLSEDADITGAESAYAAMEAELQDMLDNIESEYPGYDEYRVNADEIEHDPYVLISILSAWHEGVFTLDEVQSTLEMLFEKQYILTVEEEVQVRYRTETRTDSEGNPYTVEVPYNYYILHVDLENFNLSHVPVYIMGEEQLSMYAMYMSSLGNRPDLFPQSGYVSKYYENPPADYEVPAPPLGWPPAKPRLRWLRMARMCGWRAQSRAASSMREPLSTTITSRGVCTWHSNERISAEVSSQPL